MSPPPQGWMGKKCRAWLKHQAARARSRGMKRVIFTAGVFDLFHAGHMNLLRRSRELGDMLVVGVLTDLGAAAYKPKPPVYNEHVRLDLIQNLKMVDAAFLQPGTDPSPLLLALDAVGLRPAVMTHGDDWKELREGNETLERLGIALHLLPYTPDVSTTRVRSLLDTDSGSR